MSEASQEAWEAINSLAQMSYEYALHNYDGLTLDAEHNVKRQRLKAQLVDILTAAIEVDRKNHPNFVGGDAIFMSRLNYLRETLSAYREASVE